MVKYTDFPNIDTPALLIENSIMLDNIKKMQKFADANNLKLRPHIKTHKIPELAKIQLEYGAIGIAVAKLSEAEIMAEAGIEDILIANIIVSDKKIEKLGNLHKKCKNLSVCVDSIFVAEQLRKTASDGKKLNVYIEIDCGFNRCGLSNFEEILKLAKFIKRTDELNLVGLLCHAGQIYSAKNEKEAERISRSEIQFLTGLKQKLKSEGIEITEISIGSTPEIRHHSDFGEITELRVGNYIFYDMIQVSLGSAEIKNCALSVLAQIISVPASNRAIIDAGSKCLGTERGAHSFEVLKGFGYIYNKNAEIVRLSEEHGIIHYHNEMFNIGERIRIIPNHVCYVMNLFDYCYLVDGDKVLDQFKITARGKSQ